MAFRVRTQTRSASFSSVHAGIPKVANGRPDRRADTQPADRDSRWRERWGRLPVDRGCHGQRKSGRAACRHRPGRITGGGRHRDLDRRLPGLTSQEVTLADSMRRQRKQKHPASARSITAGCHPFLQCRRGDLNPHLDNQNSFSCREPSGAPFCVSGPNRSRMGGTDEGFLLNNRDDMVERGVLTARHSR